MLGTWILPIHETGRYLPHHSITSSDDLVVFGEETAPAHPQHAENGFFDDAAGHFGNAFYPVGKRDRYFYDLEAQAAGGVLHFDLEGIPDGPDLTQVDGFQYFAMIADKAGSGIHNGHPGD